MFYTHIESPVGSLTLVGDESGLQELAFGNKAPQHDRIEDKGRLAEAIRQLRAYFAGDLEAFELSLTPKGTPFQLQVWKHLCDIPYGETISYGELARRIGNPNASRAVGLANGS